MFVCMPAVFGWLRCGSSSLSQGAIFAREEDERVFGGRDVQVVDLRYDDLVIAGGMLGHDFAFDGGEGVGE